MVAQFIKEVGFPIFVAVYVLMRLEPVLSNINTSVAELTKAIAVLSERIALMR
ncbi:MAG TPA: YvrJ family protein [Firmicutes bacterium]|nr:YvrJ family protein [Bacillota bacterium]